jgi:hypothetical protein
MKIMLNKLTGLKAVEVGEKMYSVGEAIESNDSDKLMKTMYMGVPKFVAFKEVVQSKPVKEKIETSDEDKK